MLGFQGYLGHQQSHRHVHRLLWQHWEIQTGGLFVTLPIWWRELRHNICFFVTFQATHKLFWHLKLKSKINNQSCHWPMLEWLPLERVRVSGPMSCSAMIAKSEILKKSKNVKNWSQYTQIDQCFSTMSLFTSKPHLTTQLFSQKQTNSSGLVNWQQKNIDLKRATPKQKNEKKSVKSAY